jgi:folate-binding protein YgfZ
MSRGLDAQTLNQEPNTESHTEPHTEPHTASHTEPHTASHAALRQVQRQAGAQLDPAVAAGLVPATYAGVEDEEAIAAARTGVALADYTDWTWLQFTGDDRLTFLHNQTTQDFRTLEPGQGRSAVVVTSTARTIDWITGYATDSAVDLLAAPRMAERLIPWLDRYIFPMDRVAIADRSAQVGTLMLIGPGAIALLASLGLEGLAALPEHQHGSGAIAGMPVRWAIGSGLGLPGVTLWMETPAMAAHDTAPPTQPPQDQPAVETPLATVWQALHQGGATPLGATAWERLRIEQGRPMPGQELTDDFNPLEAGLWQSISFNKGCYIGQETIARLDTYKGVKQQLWGIQLDGWVEPGTPLHVGTEKVGRVTSCVPTAAGAIALGYVRTKAGGAGLTVTAGDRTGITVAVPLLTRERAV